LADLEKFRAEMRAFIEKSAPPSLIGKASDPAFHVWGGKKAKYPTPDAKAWLERAAEVGLTAPTWPKEYGGAGLSREEGKIFEQELAAKKLPAPLVGFGLMMIGPTLLTYGN